MKRFLISGVFMVVIGTFAFAAGDTEAKSSDGWAPSRNVEWFCTSSPGGGSSIFTQTIIEIIKEEGLVNEDILINYKTDGGGAVGRREVSRKKSQGHTLLTFNNGDLQPLVQIEGGDLDNLTPIAVMAIDGQVLLVPKDSKFKTAQDFIDTLKSGKRVIMGGSKGDDINLANKIKEEVGGNLEYLVNDSTGDALTQILGGNIEVVIAKPAASFELVSAGELRPLVAATSNRLGKPFDAPTFKDLGFNIELNVFRGIAGPQNMPLEAVKFWSDVFSKVVETERWKKGYLGKFLLTGNFLPYDKAKAYMQNFEDRYTSSK